MTSIKATTQGWDNVGGGWKLDGKNLLWTCEPLQGVTGPVIDLVRLSLWKGKESGTRSLRIETGLLALDGDETEKERAEAIEDALEPGVDLPEEAITGLAYIVARILGTAAVIDVVTRISDEETEYLHQLIEAAGGDPDVPVGEAEAALAAKEGTT
jgi:hypothetical protein